MAISVQDAMELPIMEKMITVGGHQGLTNSIKWVTVVEVLEDTRRLQQGEFLITTGFELLENEKRLEVFHNLFKLNKLSGIAIYTSFYIDSIPDSFIDLANKYNLPLIEIPIDINFSEITKAILEQIVNKQMLLLEHSENIHRKLTKLILNNQSLTVVTNVLANLTHSKIIVFNDFYEILYTENSIAEKENYLIELNDTTIINENTTFHLKEHMSRSLENESTTNIDLNDLAVTISPIIAKQSCFGWIIMLIPKSRFSGLDDIAIEHAATIYAMEFLKEQAIEAAQLRLQSDFLDDLFNNNYEEEKFIIEQAKKLDYNLSDNQIVFHISFKHHSDQIDSLLERLYYTVEQLFKQTKRQYLIRTKQQSVIIMTSIIEKEKKENWGNYHNSKQLAKEIISNWNFSFENSPLIIGIGRGKENISEIGNSAIEARHAVQLHELIDAEDQIAHYSDLGMYDLLLNMRKSGIDLEALYLESIGELIMENNKGINLIETIDVFLRYNQSVQLAADALFIHRHTLRYRLNQIELRTGLDIKLADERLRLQLSVMSYKLLQLIS